MKNFLLSCSVLLCTVLLVAVLPGCGGAMEVAAIAPTTPIVIDGKSNDWDGHLWYYRDVKLTVGVSNDKNFFYLCVVSADQAVYRSILMRGLTVWFDTTAGKGKYFGMRFPLDIAESTMPADGEERPGSMDELMKRRADGATKLAILGPAKENTTEILLPGKFGIDARIGYTPGTFVYEMKVPLGIEIADGLKLAFSSGDQLSIRLETPEFEKGAGRMRNRDQSGTNDGGVSEGGMNDGGMAGEGEGGIGGRRGGGRRGGGVGGTDDARRPQSIDFLLKVQKAH